MKLTFLPVISVLLFVILATTPLAAQDNKAFRFGAGFSSVIPTGDWSNIVSTGFGPSVFIEKPFSDNLVVRGGADYIIFAKRIESNVDMTRWGISMEGNWYFNEHNLGPYALASLDFNNTTYTWITGHGSISASNLRYGAGFGYRLHKRFSVSYRHVFGHVFDNNILKPSDFLPIKVQGGSNTVAKGNSLPSISIPPKELNWAVSPQK
jgi:hypothetical protein